jgi:hypothetical protein
MVLLGLSKSISQFQVAGSNSHTYTKSRRDLLGSIDQGNPCTVSISVLGAATLHALLFLAPQSMPASPL